MGGWFLISYGTHTHKHARTAVAYRMEYAALHDPLFFFMLCVFFLFVASACAYSVGFVRVLAHMKLRSFMHLYIIFFKCKRIGQIFFKFSQCVYCKVFSVVCWLVKCRMYNATHASAVKRMSNKSHHITVDVYMCLS